MLRPYTAYSASGVKKYFETADYYSQGNEIVGNWGGKLAERLGLAGQVSKDAFGKLCDGINPATGKQLTPRMNDHRRIGDDLVWSLPKEVGAAIMLRPPTERDALLAMVERRVHQVMTMIEADVQTRVRKDGAFENRPGDGLAYGTYLHTTARPVGDLPPDPHPHWHCFTFNATDDPVENRIKAADFANIYRDRSFYEAVFYSLVASDMAGKGMPIERRADGKWGIAGLQPMGVTFSKRTGEIEDEAKRLNIVDDAGKAKLGATTRAKKREKELSPAELQQAWDAQLTDADREAMTEAFSGIAAPPAMTADQAVSYAIAHCSEKLSVMPERELKRVALLHGLGSVTPDMIDREMLSPHHGLIVQEIDGRRMATTHQLQREEDTIARFAARGLGTLEPVGVAEGLTREMADGRKLNDGQWKAACGLLNSENRVNLVEGPAGAGKSSMLGKFDEGMRLAGQNVTYLATTAKAAEVLQEDGFDAETVARFLVDKQMQEAARGGRVVVDEASMLGHKDAVRLVGLAESLDLKPIFVGDPMQHGSVPRGSFLHVLKEYGCIRPHKLTQILRQDTPEYRAAAGLLSEGRTLEGLDALDSLGWVKEMGDDAERYRSVAAEYVQAVKDKKSVLVVSPTHAEAGKVTDAIRAELRQAGRLGAEDRSFTRLVAVDASEAERKLASTYRPGDVIQFHQNAKGGFKKGDRLTVSDPAKLPLAEAGKFSLYRPGAIGLAEGDVIRFTGNVKTMDGQHTLKNGMTRTVAEITSGGNIRLDNGWLVGKDAGLFRHGFVETSFGSQGRTVQRAILAMSAASAGAMNQEQLYVSASRARERTTLYTDDKAAVRQAVGRSSRKVAALDLRAKPAAKAKLEAWHRWQAERKRRRGFLERLRTAWPLGRGPQGPTPPRGHAERVTTRQEKGYGHDR